jgi:hypothetical protein
LGTSLGIYASLSIAVVILSLCCRQLIVTLLKFQLCLCNIIIDKVNKDFIFSLTAVLVNLRLANFGRKLSKFGVENHAGRKPKPIPAVVIPLTLMKLR